MATPVRDREAVDQAVVRGSELLKQGKLDDATRSFRTALELDPENTKILALLGLCLFRGNQFADARPIYEELVDRASTDASHRLNLGLVYLKLGEGELAIHALEASRALDPSQGRAVSYLGLAYARAGRYAEAYRSFLIAGQHELASEIEINLTPAERDGIHSQLGKTPRGPLEVTGRAGLETKPTSARTATPSTPAPTRPASASVAPKRDSAPAIAVARPASKATGIGDAELSSPEITIERPPAAPQPQRMTESQMFVLPKVESAVPEPALRPIAGDVSMVSLAVAVAEPAKVGAPRTVSGGTAPRPLSELATDQLVRPDEGDDGFEISASGALVIRVDGKVWTRLDGIHITGGDLAFEPATRRSRGHQTEERIDHGGIPMHVVHGHGYLIAAPGEAVFSPVALDDDILYLREDLVYAFESTLRWESGNVPGLRGKLPVVQFRGDGALVVRSHAPLVRVKLPASGVLFVDAERIAGWIGRVIPRAVVPPKHGPLGAMGVECTGEGIVLVEPTPRAQPTAAIFAALAALQESLAAGATMEPASSGARPGPPPPPGARDDGKLADATPDIPPELADLSAALAELHDPPRDAGDAGSDVPPGRDEF